MKLPTIRLHYNVSHATNLFREELDTPIIMVFRKWATG